MLFPAALLPTLGAPELLIILVIIMLFFGVGKLPEVGRALGKSIRAFKEGQQAPPIDVTSSVDELTAPADEASAEGESAGSPIPAAIVSETPVPSEPKID